MRFVISALCLVLAVLTGLSTLFYLLAIINAESMGMGILVFQAYGVILAGLALVFGLIGCAVWRRDLPRAAVAAVVAGVVALAVLGISMAL